MSYAESAYGAGAYGADSTSGTAPPGQVIPPPIPGGSTAYYYGNENVKYPYAYGGWAGARPKIVQLPGGVVVMPHPETGVVDVQGWWPNASFLHFIRIHPDGSRHPVRGGLGVEVLDEPRRNSVSNPSIEIGTNGYVPGVGSPTLTRVNAIGTAPAGEWHLRATIAGAGQCGLTVPTSHDPDLFATAAATLRISARPTALRFEIGWTAQGGGALSATNVSLTADQINTVVNQWARLSATVTPPVDAVTPTFKIVADGLPAGATMDVDAVLFEPAATDGSYFDGGTLGATWLGTTGLSASLYSPQLTVRDPDCPLDVPVSYLVADPALTGGFVVSDAVSLASSGRFCWLTHPRRDLPIRCDLRMVPTLQREIDQGVYWPVGRPRALTVSAPQRRSPTADLMFNAMSFAERDELVGLMADGVPMLLRAPARYGYGLGAWWSMGTVSEDREERKAYQDAMVLTAASTEVDPPSPFQATGAGV